MKQDFCRVHHKLSWRSWVIIHTIFFAICHLSSSSLAQKSVFPYWQKLKEADSRITSSRVTWKYILTKQPNPSVNVEKYVARTKEESRQRGASDAIIQSDADTERAIAQRLRSGYQHTSIFNFTYNGTATYAYVQSQGASLIGQAPAKDTLGQSVQFYDGRNFVALESADATFPKRGRLARGNAALTYSAPSFAEPQLLIGHPISRIYSPADSTWREGTNNTVVLSKKIMTGEQRNQFAHLTISKNTWRPIKLELENVFTRRLTLRFTASGYKMFSGGIWFPTRITTEPVQVRPGHRTETYSLVSAAFNQNADLSALQHPVAKGTLIDDFRFGEKRGVRYRTRADTIPSDDKVRLLLDKEEQGRAAAARQQRNAKVLPIALALGTLFMTLGFFLWQRARRLDAS